jgi:hypothetical protein
LTALTNVGREHDFCCAGEEMAMADFSTHSLFLSLLEICAQQFPGLKLNFQAYKVQIELTSW